MYGNCKKILKAICYLCTDQEETTTLDIAVYLHNRVRDEDLIGCIRVLEADKLVEVKEDDGVLLYIQPTHQGRHFKENQWAKVKHFLFTIVAVPIAVSAATTLVSLWINGFFK